jgi:predicted alpha/beta hydrolase family esterase
MKRQVVLINGGATFKPEEKYLGYLKNYVITFDKHGLRARDWTENLWYRLGEDFQVIRPEMPSRSNAKYTEWQIWFEKLFPFLEENVILVGYALGGVFLVKYLAQHSFPRRIKALFLIAAPFDDNKPFYELNDFTLPTSLEQVSLQAKKIFLYHSKDDRSIPFKNMEQYKQALPSADMRVFENRGHFLQNELPELVHDVENL